MVLKVYSTSISAVLLINKGVVNVTQQINMKTSQQEINTLQ